MLKIKIMEKDDSIKMIIDENEMDFTFDAIDRLIEKFVYLGKDEIEIECSEQNLKNYESLLWKIYEETQKTDFKETFTLLQSNNLTNEDIIKSLLTDDKDNNQ